MEGNMKMNIVIDGIDEAMDRRTDMSRTSYIHTYIHLLYRSHIHLTIYTSLL